MIEDFLLAVSLQISHLMLFPVLVDYADSPILSNLIRRAIWLIFISLRHHILKLLTTQ